jgi:hypothetical protein
LLLRAGVTYYFNPETTLSATVYLESSTIQHSYGANYQLAGAFNGGNVQYNTLLNTVSSMNNINIGVRICVMHTLFYHVNKLVAQRKEEQTKLDTEIGKYNQLHSDLTDVQKAIRRLEMQKL